MNLQKEADPNLRFSSHAARDIKGTWQYISEKDEGAAVRLIEQIIAKCAVIALSPTIGRDRSEIILGLRQFPFKNYNIFYFKIDDGVEIYRVLHSSRDIVQVFDGMIDED